MRIKSINFQVLLEMVCYFVFGGTLLYLVGRGGYLSYITPRMKPYLYFTSIVMLIWVFSGLLSLFRPCHKLRSMHCFILLIPVLLLALPHEALSSANISADYMEANPVSQNLVEESNKNNVAENTDEPKDNLLDSENATTETQTKTDAQTSLYGLDVQNKTISVPNEEFYEWLVEIYSNTDKYEGYKIFITGFVFNDTQYLAEDEFVPARLAMTCCVADLTPIGMLCKYNGASELKTGEWVRVEGIIHKEQLEGTDEPQITVTGITPDKEVEGYIYPY